MVLHTLVQVTLLMVQTEAPTPVQATPLMVQTGAPPPVQVTPLIGLTEALQLIQVIQSTILMAHHAHALVILCIAINVWNFLHISSDQGMASNE